MTLVDIVNRALREMSDVLERYADLEKLPAAERKAALRDIDVTRGKLLDAAGVLDKLVRPTLRRIVKGFGSKILGD